MHRLEGYDIRTISNRQLRKYAEEHKLYLNAKRTRRKALILAILVHGKNIST